MKYRRQRSASATSNQLKTHLEGLRVLELADELGEYCGRFLAGLGADVVKVEQPIAGERTRDYGPFYEDEVGHAQSLHFWHYNVGKRSIALNPEHAMDARTLEALMSAADVILDTRSEQFYRAHGIEVDRIRTINPSIIFLHISPFGEKGPWRHYVGSDLVHLALGGVMMNCGYDPDDDGEYTTPPIAPQAWQSYHIAGELGVMAVLAALVHRLRTGRGQSLSVDVHQAVSLNTESDLPNWVFLRQTHRRMTCRHSLPNNSLPAIASTRDGRYLMPYRTYLKGGVSGNANAWTATLDLLVERGYLADGTGSATTESMASAVDQMIGDTLFEEPLWLEGQERGLPWAPIRKPEENLEDQHWESREIFQRVADPRTHIPFRYLAGRWLTRTARMERLNWARLTPPPRVDEHGAEILAEWLEPRQRSRSGLGAHLLERRRPILRNSSTKMQGALEGVRVLDLGWILASAGAGRYLASLGAEVIKIEHETRIDSMRWGMGVCPLEGREERQATRGPLRTPPHVNLNRSGSFMEINAGKLGLSLNLKTERGLEILRGLIRESDVLVDGFSPGTLERLGLSWNDLVQLNPELVYVQQTGLGQTGSYGRTRVYGPTAQAITGLSEMSGLPDPYPPAGIGYSYLDWLGAYNVATAVLAGLVARLEGGDGCHIETSQGDVGMYLTGASTLAHQANGTLWRRYGNASPFRPAGPHGVFRVRGDDRWIAIAVFTDAQWVALCDVLGDRTLRDDERFKRLQDRIANTAVLEPLISAQTRNWAPYELMERLQDRGVPAGVCQTAEDRVENDPQLAATDWLVELDQAEIGTWPVRSVGFDMSETPPQVGGRYRRSGPNYGQDTRAVLTEVLGVPGPQVDRWVGEGVI